MAGGLNRPTFAYQHEQPVPFHRIVLQKILNLVLAPTARPRFPGLAPFTSEGRDWAMPDGPWPGREEGAEGADFSLKVSHFDQIVP